MLSRELDRIVDPAGMPVPALVASNFTSARSASALTTPEWMTVPLPSELL